MNDLITNINRIHTTCNIYKKGKNWRLKNERFRKKN